jgi:nucleoporin NUP82
VAVPNDVYLTYSIFILTSAMRITALPLILNSSTITSLGSELSASTSHLADGLPAYVSLLSEPYVVPKTVDVKSTKNLILPAPPPYTKNGEFMLTPDTLRYLGQVVDRVTSQIRETILLCRAADTRCEIQNAEFARQQAKAKELLGRIEKLKGERQDETRRKLETVRDGQKALMARIDRISVAMTKKASPEVSEHEKRWFEELKRMKEEVVGRGRYDEEALASRTNMVGVCRACVLNSC